MRIEIVEDFRSFKKGDTYDIEIEQFGITYITGNNASGKSTLLQSLRVQCDTLEEVKMDRTEGVGSSTLRRIKSDVLPKIKIEGFDYDEVYALDAIVDDPSSFENSATAGSFWIGGGYMAQSQSKGEKSIILLGRFIKDIQKYLDKLEIKDKYKKNRLFIIDEVDEGLDLRLQFKYNYILNNKFNNEFLGDVLVVTHNPICMLSPCATKPKVFDIDKKKMTTVEQYINDKTEGEYSIQIIKNEINGSKQNN